MSYRGGGRGGYGDRHEGGQWGHGYRGGRGDGAERGRAGPGGAAGAPARESAAPLAPFAEETADGVRWWRVWQADVVAWLSAQPDDSLPHLMVGIPDISEMRALVDKRYRIYDESPYEKWFEDVCELILRKVRPDGYACFFQTDRTLKDPPRRMSKFAMVSAAARRMRVPMLWHKIVTRGVDILGEDTRPTFSHLACYSRALPPGPVTPDVISLGDKLWANGTATHAVEVFLDIVEWSQGRGRSGDADNPIPPSSAVGIVDLFAGEGTVAVMALARGHRNVEAIDLDVPHCESMRSRFAEARSGRGTGLEHAPDRRAEDKAERERGVVAAAVDDTKGADGEPDAKRPKPEEKE
jgi:hypothetical protein